jgi:hypothetical protein
MTYKNCSIPKKYLFQHVSLGYIKEVLVKLQEVDLLKELGQ